ncbi:hypothetical protein DRN63_00330 [Nanoarchaeota archaeon]|nr:MAG: hypothetical protein DRN63_00330 [Nanoarchaeota archaeon]
MIELFTKKPVAYKLWIRDLVNGRINEGERCVEVRDLKVKKARILGSVIRKYESEDGKYAFIVLDDGSSSIRIKAFRESVPELKKVKVGDILDVIGRVRFRDSEIYLVPEIITKIRDPNWEIVRRLELLRLDKLRRKGHGGVEILEEVVEDVYTKVIKGIRELDSGEGVEVEELSKKLKLSKEECEKIIKELLVRGEIYEPKPRKYKILE